MSDYLDAEATERFEAIQLAAMRSAEIPTDGLPPAVRLTCVPGRLFVRAWTLDERVEWIMAMARGDVEDHGLWALASSLCSPSGAMLFDPADWRRLGEIFQFDPYQKTVLFSDLMELNAIIGRDEVAPQEMERIPGPPRRVPDLGRLGLYVRPWSRCEVGSMAKLANDPREEAIAGIYFFCRSVCNQSGQLLFNFRFEDVSQAVPVWMLNAVTRFVGRLNWPDN